MVELTAHTHARTDLNLKKFGHWGNICESRDEATNCGEIGMNRATERKGKTVGDERTEVRLR